MAHVYQDPATGELVEGSPTAYRSNRDTSAFDESEAAHRHRNEGRWVNSGSDLARGTGIEQTIRSGSGGSTGHAVVSRDYQGSDTIEIQGQRMTLDIAASIGLISRNANGGFSFSGDAGSDRAATQPGETQQQQGQPDGNPEAKPEAFRASDDAENALTEIMQGTQQGAQIAAINSVIETGEVDQRVIDRLAQQSGKEPAQVAQQVQQAYDGFHSAVASRLEGAGIHDLELFDEFIGNDGRRGREMQEAIRGLMMQNDLSGFDTLAQQYREGLDMIDPAAVQDALDAAGIQHRRSNDHSPIVLTFPGHGEVSYREAVRMGLIKVCRA